MSDGDETAFPCVGVLLLKMLLNATSEVIPGHRLDVSVLFKGTKRKK